MITRCPTPFEYVKWVILKRFGTIFEIVIFCYFGGIDFIVLELIIEILEAFS